MNQLQYDLERFKLAIREFFITLEHDPDYWWARLLFWSLFWFAMWVMGVFVWEEWKERWRSKRRRKGPDAWGRSHDDPDYGRLPEKTADELLREVAIEAAKWKGPLFEKRGKRK